MADMNDIVKLAVDAHRGNVEKYSVGQSQKLLREAMIEANGGSSVVDYKRIRDGKCAGLFTLIEEILSRTVVEGLLESDFFNTMVEYRNVAEGDKNLFEVEDRILFTVADGASGTQGIRRQRMSGVTQTSIPTTMKWVKIYDEMTRVMTGRVDFNYMIDRVSESFLQKHLNDVYALWAGATAEDFGGTAYFPTAGSFDEAELMDTISHVEAAANGSTATIVATKKALRTIADKIVPAARGDNYYSDLYNLGYLGKFYGTPVMAIPQRHKVGTTEFVMDDKSLTIVAGDDKPIKFIYEGNPIIVMTNPIDNADVTQEYLYGEMSGMGIILSGGNAGIGRYQLA